MWVTLKYVQTIVGSVAEINAWMAYSAMYT